MAAAKPFTSPHEAVRAAVCDLVARRPEVRDADTMEGLLGDACEGMYRGERHVVISALREHAEGRSSSRNVPADMLLAQQAKRLVDEYGYSAERARWAAGTWALARGMIAREALAAWEAAQQRSAEEEQRRLAEIAARQEAELRAKATELRTTLEAEQRAQAEQRRLQGELDKQRRDLKTATDEEKRIREALAKAQGEAQKARGEIERLGKDVAAARTASEAALEDARLAKTQRDEQAGMLVVAQKEREGLRKEVARREAPPSRGAWLGIGVLIAGTVATVAVATAMSHDPRPRPVVCPEVDAGAAAALAECTLALKSTRAAAAAAAANATPGCEKCPPVPCQTATAAPKPSQDPAWCGDGKCYGSESCSSCPRDCCPGGPAPQPPPTTKRPTPLD